MLGTPAYMSPEQIRRSPVDARSDLFAVGTVLYELATGTHPFAGADATAVLANILEREASPFASPLDPVVRRCLNKNPDARFQSADELRAALEAIRSPQAVLTPTEPLATPVVTPPRWWWQFHQATTSVAYLGLLIPLWFAHDWVGGTNGQILFYLAVAAVLAATTLRLHLWFTLRQFPAEWPEQRRSTRPWIFAADGLLVVLMLIAVALIMGDHHVVAVLLVASAVAVLVSFAIIEPATTRAAFGRH